jgi:hypothetical protein
MSYRGGWLCPTAEEDGCFLDEGTVETNYLKDPDCFFLGTHELEPYSDEPPLLLKRHTNYESDYNDSTNSNEEDFFPMTPKVPMMC